MTDSIDDESDDDLFEDERAVLDERLEDLERRPDASIPWEEARALIRRALAR